jgi:hypothetical protein
MKALATVDNKTPHVPVNKPGGTRRHIPGSETDTRRAEIRSILTGSPVQAKLRVGAPDDAYEREADAVADRVMRMPADEIRRKPT